MNPPAEYKAEASSPPQACIIVAGMHRSGTSAIARVVNLLGADIARELTPAIDGNNDRGFWESRAVVDTHDRLLAALGRAWDDTRSLPDGWLETEAARQAKRALATELAKDFAGSRAFVVKDPRIARLLPLWLALLDELRIEPVVVISVRNPLEVAASLKSRDQFPLAKSMLMYLRHAVEAELASRGRHRLFLRYDHLLLDWHPFATRLKQLLGSRLPQTPAIDATAIDDFLTLDLYRNRASLQALANIPDMPSTVVELFDSMSKVAETGNEIALRSTCDRISATLDQAMQIFQAFLLDAAHGEDEERPFPALRRTMGEFLSPASFWFPVYLCRSPWTEHAPFAYWLIEAHRPALLVELGGSQGFSFFAFCQAVQGLGLGACCFSVDTWEEGEPACSRGAEIFGMVRSHNETHYSAFARLMHTNFDAAAPSFADRSIDLLHIDGRRRYEDARNDFETWLPKLSPRGVILLHDVSEREHGLGVYRLWSELRERYPHFEFPHGHGLGVIAIGAEIGVRLRTLLEADADGFLCQQIRQAYARLGSALTERVERLHVRKVLEVKEAELAAGAAELTRMNAAQVAERSRFSESSAESAVLVAKLEADLAAMKHSVSWRLTRPLRWIARVARRLDGFVRTYLHSPGWR